MQGSLAAGGGLHSTVDGAEFTGTWTPFSLQPEKRSPSALRLIPLAVPSPGDRSVFRRPESARYHAPPFLKRSHEIFDAFAWIGGFPPSTDGGGPYECVGFRNCTSMMPSKSTRNISPRTPRMETSPPSQPSLFPTSIRSAEGSPARRFPSPGKRRGFADTEGNAFSLHLAGGFASLASSPLSIFENVKGRPSHDGGRTFATIIAAA